ncbi:MAG: hypothetical protein CNIPEHKO_01184 [Anaerolineales bacterium]|jgi:hypothetical protein|nr:hypothetical protein [Anaerolineae bacterium]MBL8104951.1 hypothetical protein [Anaerolineales bacterium]MBV6400889.1 hypothetical protein [Anaerolineales bacterium]MCC7189453.1 hypothetical protein [Anaerolineales bacterium]
MKHESKKRNGKQLGQNGLLWNATIIAGIIVVVILLLSSLVSFFNNTHFTPTPSIEASSTQNATNTASPTTVITLSAESPQSQTPTITITPIVEPSSTSSPVIIFPSLFPSPVKNAVGTNLPDKFKIGPWHDDYIICDPRQEVYTVRIYGVEIAHGTFPYKFTFWQMNNMIEPFTDTEDSSEKYVEFDQETPVVVSKGSYIHVIMTFQRENGTLVTWIDDLYYPRPEFTPGCPQYISQ